MAVKNQLITDKFAIYNGDCNEVILSLKDESVHLTIYSPPFYGHGGGLYHYSSSPRDLSNSIDYNDFFKHYDFLVKEIERVTLKGRFTAVHCTDIPSGNTGKDCMTDFPGDIIRAHVRCQKEDCDAPLIERLNGHCGHGLFEFAARHQIWKEPLAVRNRLMSKNLAHMTIVDDAANAGVASADYLLFFRKKGTNPIPIQNPAGFEFYAGASKIPKDILSFKNYQGDQKLNIYSHWIWRRYASSVWDDVRGFLGEFDDKTHEHVLPFIPSNDGSDQEEKHVHPLQLDVYERAILLRTNPGEVVLEPFMGIGSGVYSAVKLNRKGIGIELKEAYYNQAIKNLSDVKQVKSEQYEIF